MKKITVFFLCLLLSFSVYGAKNPDTGMTDEQRNTFSFNQAIWGWQMAILDADGNQITSFGSPSTVADYKSPGNFTATYTSAVTLTLSALPITITDDAQLVYIKVVPASGDANVYVQGAGGVTLREAANVITISGAGASPFTSGDAYEVGINEVQPALDDTNNAINTTRLNPDYERRTDVTTLEDTPQNFTVTPADLGAEVSCAGYNGGTLWVTYDVNDTVDAQIIAKPKHTSAGAEEYSAVIETTSATEIGITPQVWEITNDADALYAIPFDCSNAIPYIQFQIYAAVPGASAGQIDAAYITLGY